MYVSVVGGVDKAAKIVPLERSCVVCKDLQCLVWVTGEDDGVECIPISIVASNSDMEFPISVGSSLNRHDFLVLDNSVT